MGKNNGRWALSVVRSLRGSLKSAETVPASFPINTVLDRFEVELPANTPKAA